jgi:hypothetical protein
MNPFVHVLRGLTPPDRDVVTSITEASARPSKVAIDESDVDKIGFTVDVAMRLTAERLADQDFGSPVSYLEQKAPADLADSA